eukprot:TRINITY_DN4939_c0_g1_i1.p1 TRINITY_DN4939_c0_g1~~TRINITY_DN4939_c0_g1_i1.p1  ORF type:complete len:410 (+),score=152.98 TRINITY_DN4939_c0_g1_i1:82-1230(+)
MLGCGRCGYLVLLLGPLVAFIALEFGGAFGQLGLGVPQKDPQNKMKAVAYDRHGDSSVLSVRTVARPLAGDGQIVIKVSRAALNPVDFKMRRNPQPDALMPKPKIPGSDVSGTVVAVGSNVPFKVGDQVYALLPVLGQPWGSLAEYAGGAASIFAKAPSQCSLEHAAALPLVGLTVIQVLDLAVAELGGTKGKRILVHAAAGGVGSFAVQYAKNVLGMHVTGTCSAKNAAFVKKLGADEVIDYRTQRFEDVVQGVDVVLDPMAWAYQERTLNSTVLRKGGHYCHILGSDWKESAEEKSPALVLSGPVRKWVLRAQALLQPGTPRFHTSPVVPDAAGLARIARWVDEGKIRPVIDREFPLAKAAEAMDYLEQGHAAGKVLVAP